MKEKERYELKIHAGCEYYSVTDTKEKQQITIENTINLLNQQDKRIKELENMNSRLSQGIYWGNGEHFCDVVKRYKSENEQLKQQVEELKGERLEFYNDDVRQSQVINGVHFDIEQLLVFSEYVEHEKYIIADKEKKINQLKQQLHDLPKKIVGDIRTHFLYGIDGETTGIDGETTGIDIILDSILKKYGRGLK